MTNINNYGSYYTLGNTTQQNSNQTASTGTSSVPSLADVLSTDTNSSTDSNSNSNSAYLLDLSPEAQQYLNSTSSSSSSSSTSSDISLSDYLDSLSGTSTTSFNSSSTSSNSNASFILTPQQQQKIEDILNKYKGQPMTQATYNQIQNDLNTAGLGPDQLSAKDQSSSFNATMVLLSALNGDTSDPSQTTANTQATEQTKASNYMDMIQSAWQNMNASTATDASSSDSSDAAAATSAS